jgi:hypothetical protein
MAHYELLAKIPALIIQKEIKVNIHTGDMRSMLIFFCHWKNRNVVVICKMYPHHYRVTTSISISGYSHTRIHTFSEAS